MGCVMGACMCTGPRPTNALSGMGNVISGIDDDEDITWNDLWQRGSCQVIVIAVTF